MEVKDNSSRGETVADIHENEDKKVSEDAAKEGENNTESKSSKCLKNGEKQEESKTESFETRTKQEEIQEQSSPRGVLEAPTSGSGSDSDNSSSMDRSSSFGSEKSSVEAERGSAGEFSYGNLHWKKLFGQVKKTSVWSLSTISLLGGYGYDLSKKSRKKLGRHTSSGDAIDCGDFIVPKPSWRNFSYEELKQATDGFSPDKLIGKGGHAEVYKGCLSDGQVVAVKKIIKEKKNDEDKVGDFLSELGIIAHIDHPNAAKLIGFSADRGLFLILQFSPHGSLATVLHGSEENLEWKIRYKMAIGIAEGLQYLHYNCQRRIIHRDITASNMLLSEDYEAQISDFGLAKWLPEKWVHLVVSPIEGTFGYMAPEYFMHGIVHEKTDVFAFGVLLLELITGRRAVDSSRQSLAMWAKPLLEKNNMKEIADPRLGEMYDVIEMKRAMFTASTCIHHLPNMRPNMKRVVQLLKGENEVIDMKQKSMGGRALLLDACDLEEYTSTTYLKDLNRHMELVME
ncbi:Serine/threonine protein kinase [Handroanthus impetiginosus]|uniref:non-specific serine/threonine protein kinase n=1 Tax=Handroanthus impetiginosus TaxID=429701 RepID=A0A2G9G8Q2_9LAMI|nr:Serine/threonine protein kinase [Handroanthus impetiginosus]